MLLCVRVVYQEWEQEWMIDGKSEIKSKKKTKIRSRRTNKIKMHDKNPIIISLFALFVSETHTNNTEMSKCDFVYKHFYE